MKRSEFVATLEFVSRALAQNNFVPVFECFSFTGKEVIAYNDALAIIAPCETAEAFAVNGKTLLGLLSASRGEDVDFSLGKDNEVTIKTGRSVFHLPYYTPEEFLFEEPVVKAKSGSGILAVWGEDSAKKFAACLSNSSRDLTQQGLMGICVNKEMLYGCDSDAVTRCEWLDKGAAFGPATMPNAFCETLLKATQEFDPKDHIIITAEWAKAKISQYRIYGRMIDTPQELDHAQLIKDTVKGKLTYVPVPKGLEHALSRARVLADVETAKTTLTVEGGKLRLLTSTHMGVVKDTLPLAKHPDVQADVSAAIVQRSIGLCEEMAIADNCSCYKAAGIFILISNIGA